MRVLGVDPGSLRTGYGVVSNDQGSLKAIHYGVIKVPPRKPFAERLKIIYQELMEIIETHRPETASIESVFVAHNPKSAIKLGQARGVAILAAANMGLRVEEYSALEIKKAVVGYGRAEKEQVGRMVCALLGLPSDLRGGDTTDALAAAICHINSAAILNLQHSK